MIKQVDLAQMPRKELEEYAMQACVENDILKQQVEQYEAQLRLLSRKKYGRSTEQTNVDEQQLSIFNEAEEDADLQKPEPKIDQVKKTVKKSKGQNQGYSETGHRIHPARGTNDLPCMRQSDGSHE